MIRLACDNSSQLSRHDELRQLLDWPAGKPLPSRLSAMLLSVDLMQLESDLVALSRKERTLQRAQLQIVIG